MPLSIYNEGPLHSNSAVPLNDYAPLNLYQLINRFLKFFSKVFRSYKVCKDMRI